MKMRFERRAVTCGDGKGCRRDVINRGHPEAPIQFYITRAYRSDTRTRPKLLSGYFRKPRQQPDAKVKYTFTTIPTYDADAPLRTSGLLGPVKVLEVGP